MTIVASPTTLKVSTQTRDRIKAHASKSDRTIDQYINYLIDLADRELRWDAMREALGKMTPQDWADYNAEVSSIAGADLDGLSDEQW